MKKILLLAVAVLAYAAFAGCATEPDPLDRTQPEAVNKKMFDGEWYYKYTVVDTDWQNTFTFPGEQTDYYSGGAMKVRWEITPDLLNAYMIPQRYRDTAGNLVENKGGARTMTLSFQIKKHYDIRYAYNPTTREDLNVIVENMDRPWQEREYMEVNWSESQVSLIANPTMLDQLTGQISKQPVSVYENVEFFARGPDRDHDIRIDTRKWNPATDPEVYVMNIDLKEVVTTQLTDWIQYYYGPYVPPVTIKSRHSLMKAVPIGQQTYQARNYRDDEFRRFGFFRTEFDVYDEERGGLEGTKQYLINRWDLADGKKLYWYASPDFQMQLNEGDTQLREIALETIKQWNIVVKEALGRTDDPMEFHENEPLMGPDGQQLLQRDGTPRWKYEVGDMRYSFLNFILLSPDASPLGYGPSTTDADTGEIVNSMVNVYGNWVDFVVRRAMDQYDVASGNCTLDNVKDGFYFDPATGRCDSRLFVGVYKGGIVGSAAAPLTSSGGPQKGAAEKKPQSLRQMTPALMTAYMPKHDINLPTPKFSKDEFDAKFRPKLEKAWKEELTRPTQLDLNGFRTIAGTRYESMMVPQGNLHTLIPHAPSAANPAVVAAYSPANRLNPGYLDKVKADATRVGHCKLDAAMFEPAIHQFVDEMKGKPRMEVYKALRYWIWYTTALHEMGHTMGLRHNFRGSADQQNFSEGYWPAYNAWWDKVEALRAEYQPRIDAGDPAAYMEYVQKVDELPSTHNRYGSTSIMDYMGDWVKWQVPVGAWDRGAILHGYGNKVEVLQGLYDPAKPLAQQKWRVADYQPGDFSQMNVFDSTTMADSGRFIRYYMFCSDEKVFDDAFCTRFDIGVTATEITRNFIRDSQPSYFFRNFKRQRWNFDNIADGYYINKWLWTYYTYAKSLAQLQINAMWYSDTTPDGTRPQDDFWGSVFSGISAMEQPDKRDMIPGYHWNGGEDLLRASLLYYYFLLYDVLGRPEYGLYQLGNDPSGQLGWTSTDDRYLDTTKPFGHVATGMGWGWNDKWDVQADVQQYYPHQERIGVMLDKIIALEILSIPAALNDPLTYERANGLNFWNSLWTNGGIQAWEVIKGLITDDFTHRQTAYCMKCDAACITDPANNPAQLKAYPIDFLEGLRSGGLAAALPDSGKPTRCGIDEYPVAPGMDALFAIYPIFFGIGGASHPWYSNNLADHMDSQVKGGNHRFDVPAGAVTAEFVNSTGQKTYQAVQTADGQGISYQLVQDGAKMRAAIDAADYCRPFANFEYKDSCLLPFDPADPSSDVDCTTGTCCGELVCDTDTNNRCRYPDMPLELQTRVGHKNCGDIIACFGRVLPAYCEPEKISGTLTYDIPSIKFREIDRVESMLIMMQDMIDLAGHYGWRMPGYLDNDW